MKAASRRAKGNGFERELAGDIVRAFHKFGIEKRDCYRTPLSGGHRLAAETDPGDLLISERLRKYFPFVVEAKRCEEFNLTTFLYDPGRDTGHGAWSFLHQAVRQARNLNRPALLICRKNNGAAIAIYPDSFNPLTQVAGKICGGLTVSYGNEDYAIRPWGAFLKAWVRAEIWTRYHHFVGSPLDWLVVSPAEGKEKA